MTVVRYILPINMMALLLAVLKARGIIVGTYNLNDYFVEREKTLAGWDLKGGAIAENIIESHADVASVQEVKETIGLEYVVDKMNWDSTSKMRNRKFNYAFDATD